MANGLAIIGRQQISNLENEQAVAPNMEDINSPNHDVNLEKNID